ncbi:hypothetical protein T484DRAFT_3117090 [Baffinella frigidus]|nr:hypothetical protein T484DRAFT_3117090 [Cryptophyta sp. CCMP2293]
MALLSRGASVRMLLMRGSSRAPSAIRRKEDEIRLYGAPKHEIFGRLAANDVIGPDGVCMPTCPHCNGSVLSNQTGAHGVLWMGRVWHRECLRCQTCSKMLARRSVHGLGYPLSAHRVNVHPNSP